MPPKSDSETERLVQTRGIKRGMVTKLHNERGTFESRTSVQRSAKRLKLNSLLQDLCSLDDEIQKKKIDSSKADEEFMREIERCEQYIDLIHECLACLEDKARVVNSTVDTARSYLRSPVAPLPKFCSREGEDLLKFLQSFEETTERFNYPDHDRFLLLKQQISGRALSLVESLEIDKQSYVHAKDLLVRALASPENLKFSMLKQLSEMKMPLGSDPYEYISKMRTITESVSSLKIDVDSILQFFFWSGMNETLKTQFIQITNKTKPSLREINDNFFQQQRDI